MGSTNRSTMAKDVFQDIPNGQLGIPIGFSSIDLSLTVLRSTESLNDLQAQFTADSNPRKVDLMCGVYRTDMGDPFVLPSVRMVSIVLHAHT